MVTFVLHSDGSTIALFALLSVLFLRTDTDNFYLLFDLIRNVIDQLFGIFPSETRIGNGFSVNMISDRLISLFDVTFNHQTLYQRTDIGINLAVIHHFFCDTDLFLKLLSGVGMVGINDGCRMDDIHFFVHLMKTDQIFIVIILGGIAVLADCTAKNHVSQRISGCLHLVSAINEMMWMLCRVYRICLLYTSDAADD